MFTSALRALGLDWTLLACFFLAAVSCEEYWNLMSSLSLYVIFELSLLMTQLIISINYHCICLSILQYSCPHLLTRMFFVYLCPQLLQGFAPVSLTLELTSPNSYNHSFPHCAEEASLFWNWYLVPLSRNAQFFEQLCPTCMLYC